MGVPYVTAVAWSGTLNMCLKSESSNGGLEPHPGSGALQMPEQVFVGGLGNQFSMNITKSLEKLVPNTRPVNEFLEWNATYSQTTA